MQVDRLASADPADAEVQVQIAELLTAVAGRTESLPPDFVVLLSEADSRI